MSATTDAIKAGLIQPFLKPNRSKISIILPSLLRWLYNRDENKVSFYFFRFFLICFNCTDYTFLHVCIQKRRLK